MSKFNNTYSNTNQNHPLQQNSQNYLSYKKYVSIHSEDRDAIAYPNSAEFEIELPEDITNISTMKLVDWSFPSNYDTFSALNSNITMLFSFTNLYNPNITNVTDPLEIAIYEALNACCGDTYVVTIEEGFYNPTQLATELTNKFNEAVTKMVECYLVTNSDLTYLLDSFISSGGYKRFVIVYNNVSQKIWFGNRADCFKLLNEAVYLANSNVNPQLLCKKNQVPDFSNWGLPGNLGLSRCNTNACPPDNLLIDNNGDLVSENYLISKNYLRFYYGDVNFNVTNSGVVGDNGYWLTPATDSSGNILPGAIVQYIESPYKINIFGPSYIYMELYKYNCIDETQPYNISQFTLTTNETNGIVNSAFAKIPIVSTPISQYYDGPCNSYKFFDPPVERMRKLKFRLRYHNGELVNFGVFEYTFTLEFTTLLPMINRAVTYINPSTF